MMDSTETPEQLDKLLADGRATLKEFEDGVDHGRLMLRLRTASPAHPVLLARFLFAALGMLCTVSAVVVLVIGTLDNDLSRKVQTFERALQAPEGVPAVPAVLLGFAMWWGLCWAFATLAARGLGRDAQLLPWEQQQHQKLVNEVTRLTTQKAVMERIRSTPAGARPRIATPVPGIRSATARSALGSGGFNRPPAGSGPYSGGGGFGYNTPSPGPKSAGAGGFGVVGGGFSASGGSGYSPSGNAGFGNSSQDLGSSDGPSGGGFGGGGQGFGVSSADQRGFGAPAGGGYPAAQGGGAPGPSNASGGGFGSGASNAGAGYSTSSGGFGRPASFEGPQGGGFGNTPNAALRGNGFSGGYAAPTDRAPGTTATAGYTPPAGGFGAPSGDYESNTQPQREEEEEEDEDVLMGGGGGVRLGVRTSAPADPAIDVSDIVERGVLSDSPPQPEPPPAGGSAAGGILSKARGGAVGNRATPYGSAGRVRVPNGPGRQPGPLGRNTRGGTPLGAAPRATTSRARLAAPLSFPGTPKGSESRDAAPARGMFGTPPPLSRSTEPAAPTTPPVMSYGGPPLDEVMVMEEESEEDLPTVSAARPTAAAPTAPTSTPSGGPADLQRRVPTWGPIEDPWLREALAKAEALVGSYPAQAYLEFSQEPHLPFTLVIARATPAMAVRAMVNFVEFLASIYTPPRARIELVNVAHLDRSFDQNVQAALEPYFGANVEVEADPGRVDILFTDPDPGWGTYPTLPTQ